MNHILKLFYFTIVLSSTVILFTNFPQNLPKDFVSQEKFEKTRNNFIYDFRLMCKERKDGDESEEECFAYLHGLIPENMKGVMSALAYIENMRNGMQVQGMVVQLLNDPRVQDQFLKSPYFQQRIREILNTTEQTDQGKQTSPEETTPTETTDTPAAEQAE